jgi:Fe-S-cluster containining protein
MIEHGTDGYCIHIERGTCGCTIYENRPVPCRAFDCRNDKRIWVDFEKQIPNPAVNRPDWLEYVTQEAKEAHKT